jgi:catechol 2,3-dioxygenase
VPTTNLGRFAGFAQVLERGRGARSQHNIAPNASRWNGKPVSEVVLLDRPDPAGTRATDFAVWEATHVRVRDLEGALRFWRDLLGLQVVRTASEEVTLGVPDAELVSLHPGARRPSLRGHAGLYHVALHLPSARDFAQMFARLVSRGADPRPTDHLLHWAMYLSDGDDIGVELSFETADRFDHLILGEQTVLVGTDGREQGPVEPFDMRPIVDAFSSLDRDRAMPPGTRVGHNHLHVADLAVSGRLYEQLGFDPNPSFMGMRDFNARGSFLHRLAINEWQGRGAPPPPEDAAGLHHLHLTYATDDALETALANLRSSGSILRPLAHRPGVLVADPSGNEIELAGPAT